MAEQDDSQIYRASTGMSGLWWSTVVFGLAALLAFVMFWLSPGMFIVAAIAVLIFGLARRGMSAALSFGVVVAVFLVTIGGVPMASIAMTKGMLAEYDRPHVALERKLIFSGNVVIHADTRTVASQYNRETERVDRMARNLLLLAGPVDSVTLAPLPPHDPSSPPTEFPTTLEGSVTLAIAAREECQNLLRSYRERFGTIASGNQVALMDWRADGDRLEQECIEASAAPATQFDYKVRFGRWNDQASAGAAPVNEFGFTSSHLPAYRPYRPGVRVGFAEILGPDDTILFRQFNQRAHALAFPLQFDGGLTRRNLTAAYSEVSLHEGLARDQRNLLPEYLAAKFAMALR